MHGYIHARSITGSPTASQLASQPNRPTDSWGYRHRVKTGRQTGGQTDRPTNRQKPKLSLHTEETHINKEVAFTTVSWMQHYYVLVRRSDLSGALFKREKREQYALRC